MWRARPLVVVLTPHDKGATPDIVLCVGEPPSWRGAALEVVLVPRAPERAQLKNKKATPFNPWVKACFWCSLQAKRRNS